MEEVDKIIIQTLRQIGCDIEEDVISVKQFDTDMIVNATVLCLEKITPDINLPHSFPPNMAAKYRIGQDIAQACIDHGYRGDIGYQTFLYSGESDIRRILIFLVEKLPKEEETFIREPSSSELVLKRVKCKVKEELSRPWLPFGIKTDNVSQKYESFTDGDLAPAQAWRKFWREDLPLEAIDNSHLLPTLVTLHSRGVLGKYEPRWFISKKPTSENTDKNKYSPPDSIPAKRKPVLPPKPKPRISEKIEVASDDKESSNQTEERQLAEEVDALQNELEQLKIKKLQLAHDVDQETKSLEEEKKHNDLKARVFELLIDPVSNAQKLQSSIELRSQKLVHLAKQWENHRLPLISEYRKYVSLHSSKQTESAKKAETARSLGERRRELENEIKTKDSLLKQLKLEAERTGKEAHRSAYTRRILEIIFNIDKQKIEISKVLKDTQEVQKEINTLSGQLDRCFTVADETIFADAKKDETSRKAYKLLATLHTDCDELVAMVEQTGAALREIRDLEDQIEKEKSKDVAGNLARISADLAEMQQESEALATQLRLKAQNQKTPS